MKKLLSVLTGISLIIAPAVTLVSCGDNSKPENDVEFLLQGRTMAKGSKIEKAYEKIAQDFNSTLPEGDVKIDVEWEANDAVQNRISAKRALPDLYISYPGDVAKNIYASISDQKVRDMDKVLPQNAKFWDNALKNEGLISKMGEGGKDLQAVLPLNKSLDVQVINVKIFAELKWLAEQHKASSTYSAVEPKKEEFLKVYKQITGDKFFTTADLFKDEKLKFDTTNDDVKKAIKNISEIVVTDEDSIRNAMEKTSNVEDFMTLYSFCYNQAYPKNDLKNNMFSVGLDDIPNAIFENYASAAKQYTFDTVSAKDDNNNNNKFFYNMTKPENLSTKLYLNKKGAIENVNNFFAKAQKLAIHKEEKQSLANNWNGSMYLGKMDGKTYTSNFFDAGTMLSSINCSSAGLGYFTHSSSVKENKYNSFYDLIVAGSPTKEGGFNAISQGPGLAGFTSKGGNQEIKEKTVKDFVTFLYDKKNISKLAASSGYLPSTTEAIKDYDQYLSDDYNASHPKSPKKTLEELKHSLVYQLIRYVKNNIDKTGDKKIFNLVSTTPDPLSNTLRSALKNSYQNTIFTENKNISEVLFNKDAGHSLINEMNKILPGGFDDIEFKFMV
ncbi:lipoprotein [Spiroplasma endosymbiont of Crioceris asparagi]|uniref:lipoprotein n=1 Tax=Spiroplasma endosymbiont of Crioceris asparagi TaxID=3066286 RepID=UPI0030D0A862